MKPYKILALSLYTIASFSVSLAMEEDNKLAGENKSSYQVIESLPSEEQGPAKEQEQGELSQQSLRLKYDPAFVLSPSLLGTPEEVFAKILDHALEGMGQKDILTMREVSLRFNSLILSLGQFCSDHQEKKVLVAKRNLETFNKITEFLKLNKDKKKEDLFFFDKDTGAPWGDLLGSAYFFLGELYLDGIFKSPNYQEALNCYAETCKYTEARKHRSRPALARQVLMYQEGLGVLKNAFVAQLLIEQGPFHPRYGAYEAIAEKHYSQHHLLEAINSPSIAFDMFQRAVQEGGICANYFLGKMYYKGKYIEKNHSMALQFLKKFNDTPPEAFADEPEVEDVWDPVDSYMEEAGYMLGKIYYEGTAGERNLQKAVKYFKSSFFKRKECCFYVGEIYEKGGSGIEKNDEKAAKWYLESSKHGNEEAVDRLKVMFEEGRVSQKVYSFALLNLAHRFGCEVEDADRQRAKELYAKVDEETKAEWLQYRD